LALPVTVRNQVRFLVAYAMEKCLLVLHYKRVAHRLKIFRGTPLDEVEAFVKRQLGVAQAAILRLTDEDGDPTMLTSYCPSGTELHVAVEFPQGPPPQVSNPEVSNRSTSRQASNISAGSSSLLNIGESRVQPSISNWRTWSECVSTFDDGPTGSISDNSALWTAQTEDSAVVFGHELPTTGQHYVAVTLSHTPCCVALGLVPSSTKHLREFEHVAFPFMVQLMAFRRGGDPYASNTSGGSPPYNQSFTAGLAIDMDTHVVHFFSHDFDGSKIIRMDNLPSQMKLAVFHPKHGLSAKLRCDVVIPGGAAGFFRSKRSRDLSDSWRFPRSTSWSSLTVVDLKLACIERALTSAGLKAELVKRLRDHSSETLM